MNAPPTDHSSPARWQISGDEMRRDPRATEGSMDDLFATPPRNHVGDRASPRYQLKTFHVTLVAREPVDTVSSPAEAANVLRPIFDQLDADREHFVILALDAQNHVGAPSAWSSPTIIPAAIRRRAARTSA
jgi:hypothetical protein